MTGTRAEVHELATDDGLTLRLTNYPHPKPRGVVLLLHGLGTSSGLFARPEQRNFVTVLHEQGFDAWALDWRSSNCLPYLRSGRQMHLDEVAVFDVPAALAFVRRKVGARPIVAVAHCLGAIAVAGAIAAGLAEDLAGVVADQVFLTPVLPPIQRAKIIVGPALVTALAGRPRVDPARSTIRERWVHALLATANAGLTPGSARCGQPACQTLRAVWGDVVVCENLLPETHDRMGEIFGSISFEACWEHLQKMAAAGAVVRFDDGDATFDAVPGNALTRLDRFRMPLLLTAGGARGVFTGANEVCRDVLAELAPTMDVTYLELPGYAHSDVWLGRASAIEVFPSIVAWLERVVATRVHAVC